MHRPLSPGPCVVWLYMYVCGLPGPLLICPRPANGLPSDHGCLLYFCLHQLNSDRRFLQLGQIRPQLRLSAAHAEARKSRTRQDIGSWWIKTPSDPPPCPDSASLQSPVPNCLVTGGHIQAYGCCRKQAACNYAVRGLSSLARIIGLSVTVSIRNSSVSLISGNRQSGNSLRSRQSDIGCYLFIFQSLSL